MPQLSTWQVRRFGPAASTIVLATKGGATLGRIWISAKGSAPSVAAYDAITSVEASAIVPTTVPAAIGTLGLWEIEVGTGLMVKVGSCTGSIMWRPGQAGGA